MFEKIYEEGVLKDIFKIDVYQGKYAFGIDTIDMLHFEQDDKPVLGALFMTLPQIQYLISLIERSEEQEIVNSLGVKMNYHIVEQLWKLFYFLENIEFIPNQ